MPGEYIHLTPEELETFAGVLNAFSSDLQASTGRLQDRLRLLGDSWRDRAFNEFEGEFDQTVATILKFIPIAEEHVRFLLGKAAASREARDYR